jgi:hypothetical protein
MTDDHRSPGKPAEPGNFLALRHGADSPRIVAALARVVRDEVIAQAPWIIEAIFQDSLERYCRVQATARLLSDHVFKVCEEQGAEKIPVRLWESLVACQNAASRCAADLGLTPLSRAKLAALTTSTEVAAQGLQELSQTGAAIRAKRTAALALEADVSEATYSGSEADEVGELSGK